MSTKARGKSWTKEEEDFLLHSVNKGKSDKQIARSMGRSVNAIQTRKSLLLNSKTDRTVKSTGKQRSTSIPIKSNEEFVSLNINGSDIKIRKGSTIQVESIEISV